MTAKRFNSYCDNENIRIRIDDDIKNKEVFHIYFAELDDALYCKSKLNPILDLLNQLYEENEQLKQRNNNQYNQLNQLWQLIEAKDWEALAAMDDQIKKDEERLQQEWKCYE